MSEAQGREFNGMKPIRWREADWERVSEVAKSVGLSRSEFVRSASLRAAEAVLSGGLPYFVEGAGATTQNTRIDLFRPEGDQKADTGGGRNAPDRSRSDGEAKGGPTKRKTARKANKPTSGRS
ncbi:hypothetical protein [Curvibacter delicatus]|uniref:hypothetical protein n=1 Tax=Curvibacter delicatus TaxID=80879 RepID=UPI0012EE4502|nr:hypothetical protein [Curvibacter delicatus]